MQTLSGLTDWKYYMKTKVFPHHESLYSSAPKKIIRKCNSAVNCCWSSPAQLYNVAQWLLLVIILENVY
jgi:hypothetical protein